MTPGSGAVPAVLTRADGTRVWTGAGWQGELVPGTQQLFFATSAGYVTINGYSGSTASIWASDGTAAGTRVLRTIQPALDVLGAPQGYPIYSLTPFGKGACFFGNNDQRTTPPGPPLALWCSDGTPAGTVLVAAVRSGQSLISYQGSLYFLGLSLQRSQTCCNPGWNGIGTVLWKSDGSSGATPLSGPSLDDDIYGAFSPITIANGLMTFTWTPGSKVSGSARTWISDGTEAGTQ
jgi:ELWxxDGT repeat protein